MAILSFLRSNWIAVVLILALVASTVVSVEGAHRDAGQARADAALVREKAIEVCKATSGSAALVVAFKRAVARRAESRGENDAALEFRLLASGGLNLIPLPAGEQDKRDSLPRVHREGDHYSLSDAAKGLMARGCAESYRAAKPSRRAPR